MAHFRGVVQGNRKQASRLGSKDSGLTVQAQSWQGKCYVYMWHDEESGKDMVNVMLTQHSNGAGCAPSRVVFRGPVDGSEVAK